MDSLLFIREKINRDIKTRKVAVGSKHITYNRYDKSNGLSNTVNKDSVFCTGVIYAHERRVVSMLDIENSFLNSENY